MSGVCFEFCTLKIRRVFVPAVEIFEYTENEPRGFGLVLQELAHSVSESLSRRDDGNEQRRGTSGILFSDNEDSRTQVLPRAESSVPGHGHSSRCARSDEIFRSCTTTQGDDLALRPMISPFLERYCVEGKHLRLAGIGIGIK
jgi:hypothetical protein